MWINGWRKHVMVIDFHTHIFPERIAQKTIEKLEKDGNAKAFTNGTLEGLKRSMMENNINISIVLPVVTKPSQFDSINSYATEITGMEGIISFGGIHPDTEDYKEKLEAIKRMGLIGIKLHPDYQVTYVDDPRMVRIIQYAVEIGLIVIIHAGVDIGLPDPVHCTPQRAANMLRQIAQEDARIILAHMGGYDLWDEVEEYIVGKNVWIDTSFTMGRLKEKQFVRIVKNHGAGRVLFATDSPWGGQRETLENIRKMGYEQEELDRILWKNALELLGMNGNDEA
jgi:predicted TIM-barrel fold metal-dependent hydrolase